MSNNRWEVIPSFIIQRTVARLTKIFPTELQLDGNLILLSPKF